MTKEKELDSRDEDNGHLDARGSRIKWEETHLSSSSLVCILPPCGLGKRELYNHKQMCIEDDIEWDLSQSPRASESTLRLETVYYSR